MKRILVGIDGSKEALEAARFAAHLALAGSQKLELVSSAYVDRSFGAPELMERAALWENQQRKQCEAALDEAVKEVAQPGLTVGKRIVNGAPAAALAELAAEPDVDFVVVGHRGRGRIARVLTGSVADRLVQIAPKPVLVFR